MEKDDIQEKTLSLSRNCPGIDRKIRYLLASCTVWREMISR